MVPQPKAIPNMACGIWMTRLANGIEAGQENGDRTQEDRQWVKEQHEHSGQHEEEADDQQSMCSAEFTRREWTYPRARHMSIEGSIRKIVQHDPRAAHHKGPGDEDGEQVKRRHAARGQDQGPQSREHEQPGPGLVLEANESADGRPGEPRVDGDSGAGEEDSVMRVNLAEGCGAVNDATLGLCCLSRLSGLSG